ncbi:MAG: cytochrome c3 family protein [Phycisphaerales bacterium]
MSTFFPKWTNALPTMVAGGGAGAAALVIGGVWYYFTPKYFDVGYMPTQPGGGFNHQIHAGTLGMDCRYCHTHIEESPEANIPNVSTCYGCHAESKLKAYADSKLHQEKTAFIREAWKDDKPVEWRRIHKVPDYVRNFPHNAHLNAGLSCYSCHGNIARMPVVWQHEPLSMSWCLECHREPEKSLVPKDKVTSLFWVENQLAPSNAAAQLSEGKKLYEQRRLAAPENCGACHY